MDIAPAKTEACSKINSEPRQVSCTQVVGLAGIQPPRATPTCQPLRSFVKLVLQGRKKRKKRGDYEEEDRRPERAWH